MDLMRTGILLESIHPKRSCCYPGCLIAAWWSPTSHCQPKELACLFSFIGWPSLSECWKKLCSGQERESCYLQDQMQPHSCLAFSEGRQRSVFGTPDGRSDHFWRLLHHLDFDTSQRVCCCSILPALYYWGQPLLEVSKWSLVSPDESCEDQRCKVSKAVYD